MIGPLTHNNNNYRINFLLFQVIDSDGLEKTRSLACDHCDIALNSIETLTESKYKWALASLTSNVLDRMK